MSKPKDKYRVMKDLELVEISLVDFPMQDPARIAVMKRADVVKSVALTTQADGHAHSIVTNSMSGGENRSGTTSWDNGHAHQWIMNEAGVIYIGDANGHTHGLAVLAKREFSGDMREHMADEGTAMPDGSFPIANKQDLKNAIQAFGRAKDKAAAAKHIKRRARALGLSDLLPEEGMLAKSTTEDGGPAAGIGQLPAGTNQTTAPSGERNSMTPEQQAALQKAADDAKLASEAATRRADRAESILKMSTEQRAHFDTLNGSDQDAFLAKSPEQRELIVKNLRDSDPVVFTCADGTQIRKSAGPLMLKLAQDSERAGAELVKERALRNVARLEKRAADEIPNLNGDVATKTALLGAVESIADDGVRAKVTESLKAASTGLALAFTRKGTSAAPASGEGKRAGEQLSAMAEEFARTNKCDLSKAYEAVTSTDQGRELYELHRQGK